MTAVTRQFIDRAGAVTEIEVKCAGELAHEVIYLGRVYKLTGRTVVAGRVRRLTYVEASAPGKPKGLWPLHDSGCGYRLSPDPRGGWSCEKCGWPAEPLR